MTEPITSRHNPRIKLAAKLRDRRGRHEQQRIIIDGLREIGRALDAGVEFIEAFVCESIVTNDGQALQRRLAESGCEIVLVNQSVLEKIAFGDRSDGIVAIAKPPRADLNGLTIEAEMLVAVLENVEKPGNVGAVLRSADAAGVSAVIVADAGTDLYNPNSIRAPAPSFRCRWSRVRGMRRYLGCGNTPSKSSPRESTVPSITPRSTTPVVPPSCWGAKPKVSPASGKVKTSLPSSCPCAASATCP